jgi:hypothetical protein
MLRRCYDPSWSVFKGFAATGEVPREYTGLEPDRFKGATATLVLGNVTPLYGACQCIGTIYCTLFSDAPTGM